MGHSAGSEGHGSGVRRISLAPQTIKTAAATKISVRSLVKNLFGSLGATTAKPSTIAQPFKSSFDSLMAQEMTPNGPRKTGHSEINHQTQNALAKLRGELFI